MTKGYYPVQCPHCGKEQCPEDYSENTNDSFNVDLEESYETGSSIAAFYSTQECEYCKNPFHWRPVIHLSFDVQKGECQFDKNEAVHINDHGQLICKECHMEELQDQ